MSQSDPPPPPPPFAVKLKFLPTINDAVPEDPLNNVPVEDPIENEMLLEKDQIPLAPPIPTLTS